MPHSRRSDAVMLKKPAVSGWKHQHQHTVLLIDRARS